MKLFKTFILCILTFTQTITWASDINTCQIKIKKGIGLLLEIPKGGAKDISKFLNKNNELILFVQDSDKSQCDALSKIFAKEGLLGKRIFVQQGKIDKIHLADNLADFAIVSGKNSISKDELFRAVRPRGDIFLENEILKSPTPKGLDSWSHYFHDAGNNPISKDEHARAPYITQFITGPESCPIPQIAVAAGGRVFRIYGQDSQLIRTHPLLRTVVGINGHNGLVLWKRKLNEGFLSNRQTIVATQENLLLGDDKSCKVLDGQTGTLKHEIIVPDEISAGKLWKWMAVKNNILYALIGGAESKVEDSKEDNLRMGHWTWYNYGKKGAKKNPLTGEKASGKHREGFLFDKDDKNFLFGYTLIAVDLKDYTILWHHKEESVIDGRGVCLNDDKLFYYTHRKSISALNLKSGKQVWKNDSPELVKHIGEDDNGQMVPRGFNTISYIICNNDYLFLAGNQRPTLVAMSAKDGNILFTKQRHDRMTKSKKNGGYYLILKKDNFYAFSQGKDTGLCSYKDGKLIKKGMGRINCTKVTGNMDSLFTRHTLMNHDMKTTTRFLMRAPCIQSAITSEGYVYWGPWPCVCAISIRGHVAVASAKTLNIKDNKIAPERLQKNEKEISALKNKSGKFIFNSERQPYVKTDLSSNYTKKWKKQLSSSALTPAIIVDNISVCGSESGEVFAVDIKTGKKLWTAYTGGAIYGRPAYAKGIVLVGSCDGLVYAYTLKTGKKLWSFNAAPIDRMINIYGKIMSNWPVIGGVIVKDDTVYFPAGIANTEGVHVYALNIKDGKLKWHKSTFGGRQDVSLQGFPFIKDNKLCFYGGNACPIVQFDLNSGKLSLDKSVGTSVFRNVFYPFYKNFGRHARLWYEYSDGKKIAYLPGTDHPRNIEIDEMRDNYKLRLGLYPSKTETSEKSKKRFFFKRLFRNSKQKQFAQLVNCASLWQSEWELFGIKYYAFLTNDKHLIFTGERLVDNKKEYIIAKVNLTDGNMEWSETLPSAPVKNGLTTNAKGNIILSLENGELMFFL